MALLLRDGGRIESRFRPLITFPQRDRGLLEARGASADDRGFLADVTESYAGSENDSDPSRI